MSIQLQDNLLPEAELNKIVDVMLSRDGRFPWYLNRVVTDDLALPGEENLQLVHNFYKNHAPQSTMVDLLNPILVRLNPKAIVRIKANINFRAAEVKPHGFHTDVDYDCWTSVFYLNTNNGKTIFEDGTVVESIANRLATFPSLMSHTGTSTTSAPFRSLINFVYFK